MSGFGEEVLEFLVRVSHDDMREVLTGLVEAQAACSVHQATQLLQFLPW